MRHEMSVNHSQPSPRGARLCALLEVWPQPRLSMRPSCETRRKDAALLRMRSEYVARSVESTYQGAIIMRMKHALLSTAASLAVALVAASLGAATAKAEPGLSGQVTGEGGPMEGVLVTAKKNGSTIAYTVGSDSAGPHRLPAGKNRGGRDTCCNPPAR